jgi:titin
VRGPCSEAVLEWEAPAWNGGQPITAYSVQFRRIGASFFTTFGTVAGSALSATVTGLFRVGYEFRVFAVNSVGTSAQSNIAADGFALGAPTNLTFTRDPCNQAQLSWVAPTQSECVVVVNYRLEYRVGISGTFLVFGTVAGTETTGTITGLDPTLRYQFRVARIAEDGPDSFSGTVTSGTVPATPTSVVGSLTQNAGEVNLVWDAVEQQCFANTDYNVQFRPDTTTIWSDFARAASANKFATVTGLTAGVTYLFRVRAVNSVGNSGFSTQSQPVSIPFE